MSKPVKIRALGPNFLKLPKYPKAGVIWPCNGFCTWVRPNFDKKLWAEDFKLLSVYACLWFGVFGISFPKRIHWRLSKILKTSKIVYQVMFWYVKVGMSWKCIQFTIHWDKTRMLKAFSSDKINNTKYRLLFSFASPTHHNFTLICSSYMIWSTQDLHL